MTRAWLAFPVLALSAFGALAADNGFYVGGSIGQAGIEAEDEVTGLSLDDEDNGFKAIAGFRPLDFLAFEVNYVDLGNPQDEFLGQTFEIDATGLDAFVVGMIPIALVDLYAKVGFIAWSADLSAEGFGQIADESGEDLAYGAGVQVRFGSAAVRAEYEVFDISDLDDVNMISVGFTWTFL